MSLGTEFQAPRGGSVPIRECSQEAVMQRIDIENPAKQTYISALTVRDQEVAIAVLLACETNFPSLYKAKERSHEAPLHIGFFRHPHE